MEKPELTQETSDMVKLLLKLTITESMKIENAEDRLKMLPHILEGIDLLELKR